MKTFLIAMVCVFALNANADIEYVAAEQSKATTEQINTSRACFQELATQGCADPGEDVQQFRSCMNNVYSTLSTSCRKLMTELYR